jgi:hypothetical protein
VQPAEWASPLNTVTGTRSIASLTFGLGIPDAVAIPCTMQSSPAQLEIENNSGIQQPSQFRPTACWPSGHVKWVLVDGQLSTFAEGSGYDITSLLVTQVVSGGGNNPATSMAVQCAGSGAPIAACPDANQFPAPQISLRGRGGLVATVVPRRPVNNHRKKSDYGVPILFGGT